jgi:hypothetical protein
MKFNFRKFYELHYVILSKAENNVEVERRTSFTSISKEGIVLFRFSQNSVTAKLHHVEILRTEFNLNRSINEEFVGRS